MEGMFLDAFLIGLIPDEIHPIGPPHSCRQITQTPVWRHDLRQLGPSVQQETPLFAPLLACPLENPVPLVIVPHPYPYTATEIQSPDGGSCPLVPGRPSVSGSFHYAGCLAGAE